MRIPVDNRFTDGYDGYIVYYFRISSMSFTKKAEWLS